MQAIRLFWLAVRNNQLDLIINLLQRQQGCKLELLEKAMPYEDQEKFSKHNIFDCFNNIENLHEECYLTSKFQRELLNYIDREHLVRYAHPHDHSHEVIKKFRKLELSVRENAQARSLRVDQPMHPKQQFEVLKNVLKRDDFNERTIHYTFGCNVPQCFKEAKEGKDHVFDKVQLAELKRYESAPPVMAAQDAQSNAPMPPEDQLGYPEKCWLKFKSGEVRDLPLKELCSFIRFRKLFIDKWAYYRYTPIGFRKKLKTEQVGGGVHESDSDDEELDEEVSKQQEVTLGSSKQAPIDLQKEFDNADLTYKELLTLCLLIQDVEQKDDGAVGDLTVEHVQRLDRLIDYLGLDQNRWLYFIHSRHNDESGTMLRAKLVLASNR